MLVATLGDEPRRLDRALVRRHGSRSSSPRAHPGAVERLVLLDPAILRRRRTSPCWWPRTPARTARYAELRGGDRPALRREPAPPRAARARRGGAPRATSSRTTDGVALPLHARRRSSPRTARWPRRRRRSTTVRVPTLLVLGERLLPAVRPPARRAPRRARRPARGGHRARAGTRCSGTRSRRRRRRSPRSSPAARPDATRGASARRSARRRSRATSSRIATPSSASSRVIVSGGTTMTTFQCVIR